MKVPTPERPADILIVDDTPANLRLLSQLLSDHGYAVRAVTSGIRALESAWAAPPDLILLDIRMPEMDGCQVCERLKEDERTADIPVIFISALDEIQDKVRAFNVGGVDYITKPFQIEEVLARIETHLTLHRLQKRLEEANQRFERELLLAGKIQANILPSQLPEIPGWGFSTVLKPARETSGDFFDIFRLPNGQLGLLVADVVDKGVAAALLMAISWDLIDTYVSQYPDSPQEVFLEANRRMLMRLESIMLLTVFYGILDPQSGRLVYCNAGHAPPLLLTGDDGEVQRLIRTGPPLGVVEDASWEMGVVDLLPGDALIIYTDGVTDAEGAEKQFFGEQRLLQAVQTQRRQPAETILSRILTEIETFAAGAPQYDDIALMIAARQGNAAV